MSATRRKESSPVRPAARAEGLPHRLPVVRHPHIGKPRALNSMLEPRALFEMALLPASLPLLLKAPRGDGHPVLLLPGFMADDKTLIALKLFLRSKGYDVHTWGVETSATLSRSRASSRASVCPTTPAPRMHTSKRRWPAGDGEGRAIRRF